jgi:hypothetical protein
MRQESGGGVVCYVRGSSVVGGTTNEERMGWLSLVDWGISPHRLLGLGLAFAYQLTCLCRSLDRAGP